MDTCLFAFGAACRFDSGATASWVQAIGSIAAIGFAWFVGRRDGRTRAAREAAEDRRSAEARLGWLHSVRASVEAAAVAVRSAEIAAPRAIDGDGGLEAIAAELALAPPDKVGHSRAITMLTETRRSVAMARQQLRLVRSGGYSDPGIWRALREGTSNAQMEMVQICLEEGAKLGH